MKFEFYYNRGFFVLVLFFIFFYDVNSQVVKGVITSNNQVVPFANIVIEERNLIVSSNENGEYRIGNIELGETNISFSALGMIKKKVNIDIKEGVNILDVDLLSSVYSLDQVVVTGTKTFKRKTDSPVIVNVIDSKKLIGVNACNIAEGLNFQPAVRVETDCQTCNYTQLRMNGLSGGYSQILINGKAIFSPLTGLYGMEQIPQNMISKIEIVRGGGSALYGSSAVGGVVNIITKKPLKNNYYLAYDNSSIAGLSDDRVFYGNASVVSKQRNSGVTFFVNNRNRMWYDHNGDNFSELPLLKDNSFGSNLFLLISKQQKIEINLGSLYEYRYGGEMIYGPAHLSMQSEERVHDIKLGNIDYQINFNQDKTSLVSYLAAQKTQRTHYTGIRPEIGTSEDIDFITTPPYGRSINLTRQSGLQVNHKLDIFNRPNVITFGSEYISDFIIDEILTYNYLIDQKTNVLAAFIQSDFNLSENINFLSGFRFDKHSMLDNTILSPRFSILYRLKGNTQFRLSYSSGFRAPQAFDADLHIAFSGGGVSRISLADDLKQEDSHSFSASINYDKVSERFVYGFTLEGFYTVLKDAFIQDPNGSDSFGDIFIKRNGPSAIVSGFTLEKRLALDNRIQFESGFTIQSSLFDQAISYSENLFKRKDFLKTPNNYGYATLFYTPVNGINLSFNFIHTGKMTILHLAGSANQLNDEYVISPVFNEMGIKATYTSRLNRVGVDIDYSIGVKNLTDTYQQDFDTYKNRDSNFIYGPTTPRTYYLGLVLKSI